MKVNNRQIFVKDNKLELELWYNFDVNNVKYYTSTRGFVLFNYDDLIRLGVDNMFSTINSSTLYLNPIKCKFFTNLLDFSFNQEDISKFSNFFLLCQNEFTIIHGEIAIDISKIKISEKDFEKFIGIEKIEEIRNYLLFS